MEMKKLLTSVLCAFMLFLNCSSVLAVEFDQSNIDNAYTKICNYYKERKSLRSLDEIIALEALGMEAENGYTLPDINGYVLRDDVSIGDLSKGIIVYTLLGKNPKDINGINLIEKLESYVKNDGSLQIGSYPETSNTQVWALYALETVNSNKVESVANYLLGQKVGDNDSFAFGFGGDFTSADVTGWCVEALTLANKKQEVLPAVSYLQNNERYGDNGEWGYSWGEDEDPNSTSQACVLMGLLTYDKNKVLSGEYNYNDNNPLDVLADSQNADGTYWNDQYIDYETFDTVRALGTYKNGSVILKAQSAYQDILKNQEENKTPTPPKQPTNTKPNTSTETNKTQKPTSTNKTVNAKVVETSDNNNIIPYLLILVLSTGLLVINKKKNEEND